MINALNPLTFPLYGSRLIEASAGTGKTYTIAALYIRLILRHGGDNAFHKALLPTDILVLTFTEAATSELKDRIRERLAEAADVFRGAINPNDQFMQQLLADYADEEQRIEAAKILDEAAQWMDEAAVSTIHGWCYRMLREHAFDSNSLFDMNLLSDTGNVLQDIVQDYWRCFFYPYSSEVLAALNLPRNPQDLLSAIRPLLKANDALIYSAGKQVKNDAALPDNQTILDAVQKRDQALNNLRQQFVQQWSSVKDNLLALYPYMNKTSFNKIKTEQSFAEFLDDLYNWCHAAGDEPVHFQLLASDVFTEKLAKKKPADLQPHLLFEHLQRYLELRSQPLMAAETLLVHAARWVDARLAQHMRLTASVSFDDMLVNLHKVLQGEQANTLAASIAAQFPVILVDEFQDTDPVQYAIFNRIYQLQQNHSDSGIFLIGDPKQAIYSFRGADIFTYLQARRDTAGRHYSLDTNYRSTKALVDAANAFFANAEENYPAAAFRYQHDGINELPFTKVNAFGKKQYWQVQGKTASAINCWWLNKEPEAKARSIADYRQQMAQACASTIVQLLNDASTGFAQGDVLQRLNTRDIAILVRSAHEADIIRSALAERQLPSVYLSERGSVFSQPQAIEVLYLLQAVAEPTDEQAIRRVLACVSLNLPYADILAFDEDEQQHEAVLADFYQLREQWRRLGILPMIRRFMLHYQLAERLAQQANGERATTNWLHLAEWLQQQSVNAESEKALIRLLEQQINDAETDEEHVLRLESDAGLIKVITIHKSKGLQYPLVFLPFIAAFRETSARDNSYLYQAGGQRILELDKTFDAAKMAREKERLDEDIRLFYVAITRAEYACYLGIAPVAKQAGWQPELHKSAVGYLLLGEQKTDAQTIYEQLKTLSKSSEHIAVCDMPQPDNQHFIAGDKNTVAKARHYHGATPEHWWVASYSALHYSEQAYPEDARHANLLDDDLPVQDTAQSVIKPQKNIHHFTRGAQAGVFLHDVLEWAGQQGFASSVQQAEKLDAYLQARCTSHQWDDWYTVLQQWLYRFLQTDFQLPQHTIRLTQLQHTMVEMEFWLSVTDVDVQQLDQLISQHILPGKKRPPLQAATLNGILKGFIDLVFEQDGRYYIADYKSNWLGEDEYAYTAQAMEQVILAKRYDIQYVLYTLALHRLLKVRLPDYRYDQHIGGIVYWFLRGVNAPSQGLFFDLPPQALIEQLDRDFMAPSVAQLTRQEG